MTLFSRLFRLARADAHGVLDSLEDRTLLLRQCLREAELEVARKTARRDELDASLELLARQREQQTTRAAALDDDVRLALGRDEDELARFAIRRLLALRKHAEHIDERVRQAREERARLAERLASQEGELAVLHDRVRDAIAQERAASRAGAGEATSDASVRDEEIELELLRRRGAPAGAQP
jgi:phage shock protein A